MYCFLCLWCRSCRRHRNQTYSAQQMASFSNESDQFINTSLFQLGTAGFHIKSIQDFNLKKKVKWICLFTVMSCNVANCANLMKWKHITESESSTVFSSLHYKPMLEDGASFVLRRWNYIDCNALSLPYDWITRYIISVWISCLIPILVFVLAADMHKSKGWNDKAIAHVGASMHLKIFCHI